VINCAGKTGSPNVDWCEDHKEETLRSNTLGPLVLLGECGKRDIHFVHLSTGCIYEGTPLRSHSASFAGFTEEDPPNFFGSFYSRSKGWADQILKDFPVLQLRLRMPFDDIPDPRNLITKLERYPRVLDAENSLTYIPDFLQAAAKLIERRRAGIYNIVNPGSLSPYRVMELYREIVEKDHRFERLTLADLPGAVRAGRSNCILSTAKLEKEDIRLEPVEEAMRKALAHFANVFAKS
ncbi:MAG: sugar nucleotide-binding protein, partial [Patescibacteria group bacterium]